MELVLIRGLPGSGKTTYARRFYSEYVHCEADHYFYDKDGVYRYNPDLIRQAHAACQKKAREALRSGKNVVVSNTFVRQWELLPYRTMAEEFKTRLTILTMGGDYGNIHGVPDEIIARMRDNWEV